MAQDDSGRAGMPASTGTFRVAAPHLSLPKGGGAIRGIGEKFAANPVTGTGSLTVPIAASPGRAGFGPQLTLSYDSGAGNGPFGLGWSLSLPAITRKTDKGLPRYTTTNDADDVYLLSGVEDLVPVLLADATRFRHSVDGFTVHRYRPRIDSLFARIERWTNDATGDVHWRSISADNVVTLYGTDANSRTADPCDDRRVFSWLIAETRDDRGQAVVYTYKQEDEQGLELDGAHERNRARTVDAIGRECRPRTANRYIKRVRYGIRDSLLDAANRRPRALTSAQRNAADWMFELVFDYGDHDADAPLPDEPDRVWPPRPDPFSTYRAGFESRTYRLCRRTLMFHHFEGEPGVGRDCLVASTEFQYAKGPADAPSAGYSLLRSVTQRAHQRSGAGYRSESLPPLEFEYSEARIDPEVREVRDAEVMAQPPSSGTTTVQQWVDLDGEGLPGILSERGGAWFYRPNMSQLPDPASPGLAPVGARLAATAVVTQVPSWRALASGQHQFLDLGGDGQLDLATFEGPAPGFFERTGERDWAPFRAFPSRLSAIWHEERPRVLDLTGDGHADVLVGEHDAITWYESRGEDGFGPANRVATPLDEERGPRLLLADRNESIFLADLSGDGLTDLVRVRNGEVCYWPNLGYGRFGAKVTMDGAPWLDRPDRFDTARIRLADIDGSGTADLIYLGVDTVRLYLNRSGNSWSEAHRLPFPAVDNVADVEVLDLLGNGTACLVWSSPLAADARRPLRYVDLMGGCKPHLLTKVRNNLGAETTIEYAPSTRFYLADRLQGVPWATRLPFPVHCVSKVTVADKWRGTQFSSTYTYHHGYFDGVEREFRGFGRVDQVDVESFGEFAQGNAASPYVTADKTLYQPPVQTVSWYHTGAASDSQRLLDAFRRESFPAAFEARRPATTEVIGGFAEKAVVAAAFSPADPDAEDWRQGLRACKGMLLRQEHYELDVDALAAGRQVPVKLFSALSSGYEVRRVQERGANPSAVFVVSPAESITYHYELDLTTDRVRPDPRVTHLLNINVDDLGRVRQSVTVVYPRHVEFEDADIADDTVRLVRAVQRERHATYVETRLTTDPDFGDDDHRVGVTCETLTYDLTGITPEDGSYFTRVELAAHRLSLVYQATGDPVPDLPYHKVASGVTPQKRLVEHLRTLFLDDATPSLDQPAAFRTLPLRGLPFENYKLALTDDLLAVVFEERITAAVRDTLDDPAASGYLTGPALAALFPLEDTAGQYWLRSGIAGFAPDAARHFFLPERYRDPFGHLTTLEFDARDLFIASSADARGNVTRAVGFDYRVLSPSILQDANDNLSEVAFDVLGLPVATAVKGKGDEADTIAGLTPALANPDAEARAAFFARPDLDEAQARAWLADATTRYVYDFGQRRVGATVSWASRPASACTVRRETHVRQLAPGEATRLQVSFTYSDGTGGVLVSKVQAEPETPGGPLRWIASGRTVVNNKGNPVKQYEPYFSAPDIGHQFEDPREAGVAAVTYYDALGRTVRVELPDGSFSRVSVSPWQIWRFDQNDTLGEPGNSWLAQRTADGVPEEDARAAELASDHAGTPARALLDSLGREVLAVAHNRVRNEANVLVDDRYVTFTRRDAEGKPLWTRDARGNLATQLIRPPKPTRRAEEPDPLDPERMPPACAPGYDLAGNALFEHAMDAGDRWRLPDAAGDALFAWDECSRVTNAGTVAERRVFRTRYDALHRPTEQWLTIDGGPSAMIGRYEYVDAGDNDPAAKPNNLCGQRRHHYDASGRTTIVRADFSGAVLETQRRLGADYRAPVIDWQGDPEARLESETFVEATEYDALGRISRHFNWHHGPGARVAVYEPKYGARGALIAEDLVVRATKTPTGYVEGAASRRTTVIAAIRYDAKGQRLSIQYGNLTTTRYDYDPATLRLCQVRTTRPAFDPPFPNRGGALRDARVVQNLHHTYDAVGNVTEVRDDAYEPAFFDNQAVEARCRYTYDALYRLVAATGREGVSNGAPQQFEGDPFRVDFPVVAPGTLRNYTETYRYDAAGNIERIRHVAGPVGSWTRTHQIADGSNRLTSTGTDTPAASTTYQHDTHGNMLNLANVSPAFFLQWDYRDLLQVYNRGGGGRVYYNYDASQSRTRKVNENAAGTQREWVRIDLGGLELYRRFTAGVLVEEIESFHLLDGDGRVLLVDDVLQTDNAQLPLGPLYRYQYPNHLGSAVLELNDAAAVVSYEEWHPYGSSAYKATDKAIKSVAKRYRFTGKERDEESGLSYHGARYYAPWVGRWITSDPAGVAGGLNRYAYVHGNPIELEDENGKWPKIVDRFVKDPLGTTKQAAQTYGAVLASYTEHRIQSLSDKAEMLDPVTAVVKIGGGLVEKGKQEVKEVKQAYDKAGGGAKGYGAATTRALAGSTSAHTTEAMVKAYKAGGSPWKVVDAGLSKLADETSQANPLYHLGVATVGAPLATYEALDRGDTRAAGKHLVEGQDSAQEAAQALIPIAEEAGLLSKGLSGPGALRSAGSGVPTGVAKADKLMYGTARYEKWAQSMQKKIPGLTVEAKSLPTGVHAEWDAANPQKLKLTVDPARFTYIDLLHESRHFEQIRRGLRQGFTGFGKEKAVEFFETGAYKYEQRLGQRWGFSPEYKNYLDQMLKYYASGRRPENAPTFRNMFR